MADNERAKRKRVKKTHGPDFVEDFTVVLQEETRNKRRRIQRNLSSSSSELYGSQKDDIVGEDSQPSTPPVCRVCKKQSEKSDMLTCSECNTSAHPDCLHYLPDLAKIVSRSSLPWTCMDCKTCTICHDPNHPKNKAGAVACELIPCDKRNPKLRSAGYFYILNKINFRKSSGTKAHYWRCEDRSCSVTITTVLQKGQHIVEGDDSKKHQHAPISAQKTSTENQQQTQNENEIVGAKQEALVFCDGCDQAYHMSCHVPPLTKEPVGTEWYCFKCTAGNQLVPEKTWNETKVECKQESIQQPGEKSSSESSNSSESDSDSSAPNYPVSYNHKEDKPPRLHSIANWTVDEVFQYFQKQGFAIEASAFRRQEIDGRCLVLLQRADVLGGLSIRLGPALKIYQIIKRLQERWSNGFLNFH